MDAPLGSALSDQRDLAWLPCDVSSGNKHMTRLSKQWIRHNQVGLYAGSVLSAAGVGLGLPSAGSVLEVLINPVLALLLYVTFLEIPFVRIRRAFRNGRFMLAALGVNFLVVPIVVFGLTIPPPGASDPRRGVHGITDPVYRLRNHVH